MAESSTGKTSSSDSDKQECPLCLDPLPPLRWQGDNRQRHLCCGALVCHECVMALVKRSLMAHNTMNQGEVDDDVLEEIKALLINDRCPVCRTPLPISHEERFVMLQRTMKQHPDWVWPLFLMGENYELGTGCPKNVEKSVFYYRKAAEHGDVEAQNKMGNYYNDDGGEGASTKSIQDAIYWYTLASNQGHGSSQYALGYIYFHQKKYDEAFRLFSLAAEQELDLAQYMVASCYYKAQGVSQSLDKSIYWYKKAADQGNTSAMTNYAAHILTQATLANGQANLVGKNVLPETLYWARKAMSLGNKSAAGLVLQMEGLVSDACANCATKNEGGAASKTLSMCSQCKATAYCSKECQVTHWRKGHKWDCVDKNGVKKTRNATGGR